MGGRPSEFNDIKAAFICERLANGESLRRICSDPDMPVQSTVFSWIHKNESFAKQYARAREAQMEAMAEEILQIADDASGDRIETEDGVRIDNEFVQRSRLKVDTRKWLMSKMAPKKYGDKTQLTNQDGDGPAEIIVRRVGSKDKE